ncbi:hypothetical protein [Micromonospora humidisoli]|uniref:DUF4760 domain-containing protein n=1 Tax=Micromonospora humidisoli TaxID=2807622 RepID=A0ABS2J7B9_9ACTN|nr:hypothetical protein [Micromonospora humidisoli]MBM7082031.1 hypothetical protein [Micromonospora humidisoli]
MANGPWWGTAILAGAFTLIGVVLAQAVAMRIEKARSEREDERRWHNDRRQAYAEFLAIAFEYLQVLRVAWDRPENLQQIDTLQQKLVFRYQEILIVASSPVVRAAGELRNALFAATRKVRNHGDGESFPEVRKHISGLGKEFVSRVRDELGIRDLRGATTRSDQRLRRRWLAAVLPAARRKQRGGSKSGRGGR